MQVCVNGSSERLTSIISSMVEMIPTCVVNVSINERDMNSHTFIYIYIYIYIHTYTSHPPIVLVCF